MLKKIFIAAISLGIFIGCKSKSALNYSEEIVKKEQSLSADITTTEEKVKAFLAKEQYDSIAAAASRMENLVEVKLTEVKDLPAPDLKEAPAFKDAAIKYFRFIKSMYTGYREFGTASTAEAREIEMDKLRSLVLLKTDAISSMQRAQRKFAEANGFKLEGN